MTIVSVRDPSWLQMRWSLTLFKSAWSFSTRTVGFCVAAVPESCLVPGNFVDKSSCQWSISEDCKKDSSFSLTPATSVTLHILQAFLFTETWMGFFCTAQHFECGRIKQQQKFQSYSLFQSWMKGKETWNKFNCQKKCRRCKQTTNSLLKYSSSGDVMRALWVVTGMFYCLTGWFYVPRGTPECHQGHGLSESQAHFSHWNHESNVQFETGNPKTFPDQVKFLFEAKCTGSLEKLLCQLACWEGNWSVLRLHHEIHVSFWTTTAIIMNDCSDTCAWTMHFDWWLNVIKWMDLTVDFGLSKRGSNPRDPHPWCQCLCVLVLWTQTNNGRGPTRVLWVDEAWEACPLKWPWNGKPCTTVLVPWKEPWVSMQNVGLEKLTPRVILFSGGSL